MKMEQYLARAQEAPRSRLHRLASWSRCLRSLAQAAQKTGVTIRQLSKDINPTGGPDR